MENLRGLSENLPTSSLVEQEQSLNEQFKAAAFSITTLYRQSILQTRRAYQQGYEQCLQDIINFISRNRGDDEMPISVNEVADYLLTKQTDMKSRVPQDAGDTASSTGVEIQLQTHQGEAERKFSDEERREGNMVINSQSNAHRNTVTPSPQTIVPSLSSMFSLAEFTFTPPSLRDTMHVKRSSELDLFEFAPPNKMIRRDRGSPSRDS